LLTSAGIVGLAAQRPDGKGPHLMIQLLAARCASDRSGEKTAALVAPSSSVK
jgi:hypothetical protein